MNRLFTTQLTNGKSGDHRNILIIDSNGEPAVDTAGGFFLIDITGGDPSAAQISLDDACELLDCDPSDLP